MGKFSGHVYCTSFHQLRFGHWSLIAQYYLVIYIYIDPCNDHTIRDEKYLHSRTLIILITLSFMEDIEITSPLRNIFSHELWRIVQANQALSYIQCGTKVLRPFRKMAPFSIVDILIPFPCLPQPLPPKINVVFWTLKSFFYFRQHWFGRLGDLRRLKGMKK